MPELEILKFAKEHLGTIGSGMALILLLAVRFLPALIHATREKTKALMEARESRIRERGEERRELLRRLDDKDAQLLKILTNHISHLQDDTVATRSFHQAAVTQLGEMTHQLKELRREVRELRDAA